MLVQFKVSLGTMDAAELKIERDECIKTCQIGMRKEVSDSVGGVLVSRGIAEEIEVKGVAPAAAMKGAKVKGDE